MRQLRGVVFSILVLSTTVVLGQTPRGASETSREQLFPEAKAVNPELPNAPSSNQRYEPLTPREKFGYFFGHAHSPYVFGGALITAISWQWQSNAPFKPGAVGFVEGYGASLTERETSLFLGNFLVPTLLHQDPRYFPAPEGSTNFQRATYAASRVVVTRSDYGTPTWNGGYILGNLASAGIANLYVNNRDAGTIFSDFAIGMGEDAGYNILREFWPAVRKWVPGKRPKRLGDLILGRGTTSKPDKRNSEEHLKQ